MPDVSAPPPSRTSSAFELLVSDTGASAIVNVDELLASWNDGKVACLFATCIWMHRVAQHDRAWKLLIEAGPAETAGKRMESRTARDFRMA